MSNMKFVNNCEILIQPQVLTEVDVPSTIITISMSLERKPTDEPENSKGFIFSFGLKANMSNFMKVDYEVVIVADATHNIIKNLSLKLFSVGYFDHYLNRIPLFFIILGTEPEFTIRKGLTSFREWANTNGFLDFPSTPYVLTDCTPSFFNAFCKTFNDSLPP